MDNCSTHRNLRVRRLCAERGVLLLYLPPYLPDYNPIELTFRLLKGWLRRHYEVAPRQGEEEYEQRFRDFLYLAIKG